LISIKKTRGYVIIAGALAVVLLTAGTALASGEPEGWRPTYDLVMKWLNFGILVVLFFKFAKTPLMNFLNTQSESLARDIKRLEETKTESEEKNRKITEQLVDRESRIEDIKKKIVAQGEQEKERIIRDAREQSRYMLEDSRQRMANLVIQAKRKLQSELVDEAIALAVERLPQEITDEDNKALLDNYLSAAEKK